MHIIYDLEFDLDSFLNEMEQKAQPRPRSSMDFPAGRFDYAKSDEDAQTLN